jgi:hypothetical protein
MYDEIHASLEAAYEVHVKADLSRETSVFKYQLSCGRRECIFSVDFSTMYQTDFEGTQFRLFRHTDPNPTAPFVIYKKQSLLKPDEMEDEIEYYLVDHHGNQKRFWSANEADVEKGYQAHLASIAAGTGPLKHSYQASFNGRTSTYIVDFETWVQENTKTGYKHDFARYTK